MVSRPLRILYFGTPEFAVPSLKSLIASSHTVVAVVSQPDRPRGRGQRVAATATKLVALADGIPVLQPERIRTEEFLAQIRALGPDLGVVAAYGKLLPDALLAIPPLGMINVHGSLLPRWRGAAPVHRAVIAGDAMTGVTIMRVVSELDAGPTFATLEHPIGPDDTSPAVEQALALRGASLLVRVVDALADGSAVETPQPAEGVTYAAKITKAEGILDWTIPAAHVHNLVRGLRPWPLVSTRIGPDRVLLHRTAVLTERTTEAPGTVTRVGKDEIDVAAGDGHQVRLLALQPEGRRVMSVREFLAGRSVAAGLRLEAG